MNYNSDLPGPAQISGNSIYTKSSLVSESPPAPHFPHLLFTGTSFYLPKLLRSMTHQVFRHNPICAACETQVLQEISCDSYEQNLTFFQ